MRSDDHQQYLAAARLIASRDDRETGRGATTKEVEQIEIAFGSTLRTSYRTFLEDFGWGGAADLELLGAGSDVPAFLDITKVLVAERSERHPALRNDLLPIRNDGAGNWYCLNAAENEELEWKVVFWNHELGVAQQPDPVAPNFGTWILEQVRNL